MLFLLDSAAETTSSSGNIWSVIAIYAVFIFALYFIMFRPQKKRQKEQEQMQNSVVNGDWILLTNGMYGKVVNVVNDCVIVEFGTNKSVMIPVLRNQIAAVQEPDLTAKTVDESAIQPTNAVVGEDLPSSEDGLDDYDRYVLEKGSKKKKGLFGKKKDGNE
jgi:preprotein translocase subunit YajC